MSDQDIQKELDAIMLKTGIIKEARSIFAGKWVERVAWGIGAVFGTAVLLNYLKFLGIL